MPKLFLLMLVMTVSEIYVLMTVGGFIGTFPTILLIIATAFIGSWQIRQQGQIELRNAMNMQSKPDDAMLAGLMLVIAGVLLVTPGFITDAIGLSLLVPSIRKKAITYLKSRGSVFVQTHMQSEMHQSTQRTQQNRDEPTVIDGEFERKDDNH